MAVILHLKRQMGVILSKRPYMSPLVLVLGVQNVKTTYGKSWPGNLLQVLNLTNGLYFKVKLGHHTKKTSYLLITGPRTLKGENNLQVIMACESFASIQFDL